MLRLLVLTAFVAAAAAQYGSYAGWNSGWGAGYSGWNSGWGGGYSGWNSGWGGGYAAPQTYSAGPAPLAYAAGPAYAAAPVAAPYSYSRRYRTQDELGQATYGHEEATQNHAAVRDAAGNVAGSYNYINPDGKLITVKYTAGVNGVQVESNALPVAPIDTGVAPVDTGVPPVDTGVPPAPVQPTAEVQEATQQHLAAVAEAQQMAEQAGHQQERRKRSLAAAGYPAEKTEVILNPGHATAYRIDPVAVLARRRRSLLAYPGLYAAAPAAAGYAAYPSLYAAPAAAGYAAYPSLYAAPAAAGYAAYPSLYAAPAAAGYPAEKTEVILNPGHATAYRIDPLI